MNQLNKSQTNVDHTEKNKSIEYIEQCELISSCKNIGKLGIKL